MDLRQLRALVAVADHGTFSAAADALDTVQSNISSHVARLERDLGAELVDRSINRLTPEGEAVVRRSRRISAEIENIAADVAAFRNEVMGEVRIGIITTVAARALPRLIRAIEEDYPDVSLQISAGSTQTLEPRVSQGDLDLAIIQGPARAPDIAVQVLAQEPFVVFLPADHPLTPKTKLTLQDLEHLPMLLPRMGSTPRLRLDARAREAGIALRSRLEVDSSELAIAVALDDRTPALIPLTGVPSVMPTGWTTLTVEGTPSREVLLAQHRRTLLTPPVRAARSVILEAFGGKNFLFA